MLMFGRGMVEAWWRERLASTVATRKSAGEARSGGLGDGVGRLGREIGEARVDCV